MMMTTIIITTTICHHFLNPNLTKAQINFANKRFSLTQNFVDTSITFFFRIVYFLPFIAECLQNRYGFGIFWIKIKWLPITIREGYSAMLSCTSSPSHALYHKHKAIKNK